MKKKDKLVKFVFIFVEEKEKVTCCEVTIDILLHFDRLELFYVKIS